MPATLSRLMSLTVVGSIAFDAVETEVVADHLVQAMRGRIPVLHEPHDLSLGVGDQRAEVEFGGGGGRHRRQCSRFSDKRGRSR